MYGVVLWSDKQDLNAVIWCEDHGDLAFCRQEDMHSGVSLDAGDWIQFDLATDRQQRVATNPRLVAEGLYCSLADRLTSVAATAAPPARNCGAKVIPFEPAATAKGESHNRRVIAL